MLTMLTWKWRLLFFPLSSVSQQSKVSTSSTAVSTVSFPNLISLPPFHLYSLAPPPSLPTSSPLFTYLHLCPNTPAGVRSCLSSKLPTPAACARLRYLYPLGEEANDFDHLAWKAGKQNWSATKEGSHISIIGSLYCAACGHKWAFSENGWESKQSPCKLLQVARI